MTNNKIMDNQHTPLARLLSEIELYFDCRLSDEQEEALRAKIASTRLSHPAIDQARALMGIRRAKPQPKRLSAFQRIMPKVGIAASLALAITLAIILLRPSEPSACIAYANGQMITDEDAVLSLIAQSTSEFHEGMAMARQSIIDDIESVAPLIDEYESDFNPF